MTNPPHGRYVIDHQIGRGGMATVWRAHDTVLDRKVALKRLRLSLRNDAESLARLVREARAVVLLSHPGIVRLLDRGEDTEGPYLVMELVEGRDLKARIQNDGPLSPREAALMCAQVAVTLSYAHAQGVIHRDIKSQNVMIGADGQIKLTDFGIAQVIEASTESEITHSGMMVGTSDYLAPEQAEGRPVDGRADIYALGIVLWECLTGELPFPGENFVAVALRQVNDPLPDPRMMVPNVSRRLAACVRRATEKNPEDRFGSAREFADELLACAQHYSDTGSTAIDRPTRSARARAAATKRYRRRRIVALATAIFVIAGVGVGVANVAPFTHTSTGPRLLAAPVASFDPQGDGLERPGLVHLATDHNPRTAWFTETYGGSPAFGGTKSGVGLLVSVPINAKVTRLDIQGATPGARVEIRTPSQMTGRPLVGGVTLTGRVQQILVPPTSDQDLVVWITRLVPDPHAVGAFYAGIAQVNVWGVPNTSP